MVTEGLLQGSPKRNAKLVKNIESQKLLVVSTALTNNGIAIIFPAMHTQAFIIGLPFPNLSEISPPESELVNPQTILMSE